MKKQFSIFFSILLMVFVSNQIIGQSDEMDKLKGYIEKGNLVKAQAYCDKVTAPMSAKNAGKFFAAMALGYYNAKDFEKAAEMVLKSEDFKLSAKLAKEFGNAAGENYDVEMAAKLFKLGKEPDKAGELFFNVGKYEESAKTFASADLKMKYGDSLFKQNKIKESLYFYKRAKKKNEKFNNPKVLDYVYKSKSYHLAYSIQNFGESEFKMPIQGTVIDKMVEFNEPQAFMKSFLDSLKISKNKLDEILIEAYINNKKFDKAEAYCFEKTGSDQQICLSFLADKTAETSPETSAFANQKLGKSFIAQDLLNNYLIETANEYNGKWEKEPIDKKLLQDFYNRTKKPVEKCEQKYCEFLSFSFKKCKIKADEIAKDNPDKSAELLRNSNFMQQVSIVLCK